MNGGAVRAVATAFLAATLGATPPAALTGTWEGAFSRGGSIQVVDVTFARDSRGQLQASYSIPELTLYDEPVTDVAVDGNQLQMTFLYGNFTALVNPELNEITAIDAAWKPPVNLDLKRIPAPDAYGARSLTVRNGSVSLAGTLYVPHGSTPVPLVVVIPGSSNAGRKEWEYRGFGPALAGTGVACYVYDKRNVGESTHVAARVTFDDYASDVVAIVRRLRREGAVDEKRVGVLGMSQGGWIGAKAAAQTSNIRFLILGSGPSRSVEEQEADRVEYTLRDRGASLPDISAALAYTSAMFDAAYGRAPLSTYASALDALNAHPSWSDVVSLPDAGETPQNALEDWRAQRYDPTVDLRSLRIPVLAFFGTHDTMVPPDRNVGALEDDLRNAPAHKIVVIPGANHGLFAGQGVTRIVAGWPGTYWRWDRRAAGVIQSIAQWAKGLSPSED